MASTRINTERAGTGIVATLLTHNITPFDLAPLEHDLKEAAAEAAWRIAIDLSQVEMMGSQALGMLINMRKEVAAKKGKLVLCGVNSDILDALKITKLAALFTIVKDKPAAIAALG
ncbi:MAG TPA: STAS domain-containing protein [Phycisphaerales bacterium]|nr:STAS domain-containing protein [Phycisphaerales bacterium]